MAGSSIDRTKMDLFDAYAIRSPLGSALSCVGWPLAVEGEGAQIASRFRS